MLKSGKSLAVQSMAPLKDAWEDLQHRPKSNIPTLDVLRSLAIFLVICDHVGSSFGGRISALPMVSFGWTGVDLFFVLSGYLIGSQLWREIKRTNSVAISRFILRRGFRIWPLYFSVVAIVFFAFVAGRHPASPILADLLCVSNYFHHYVGGGWSLSTEEQFYILAPALLWTCSKVMPIERMVWLPIGWMLILPLLRVLAMHAPMAQADTTIYTPFHTHSDGLAAGLILAWMATVVPRTIANPKRRHLSELAMVSAALVVGLGLRDFVSRNAFGYTALALIFGTVTWVCLRWQPGSVVRWRGYYIGSRLSYGMYLNHFYLYPLLVPMMILVWGQSWLGFATALALVTVASLLLSFVTFSLIELPFLNLRSRWLQRGKPSQRAATASLT